jgi:hypothetical protein
MGSALSSRRWQLSITVGVIVFVVTLIGGYAGKWSWTGYSGNDTLWDWLDLLLLPVVLATAPVWLTKGSGLRKDRQIFFSALVLAFAVLVIVGYAAHLRWTGFPGNKLWDWFGLIMLPLSLAAVRAWRSLHRSLTRGQIAGIVAIAAAFGLFVAGGYALHWTWTGFQGNTLWDWVQLMAAPILFGIVVVPAAVAWMSVEMEKHEERVDEKREERKESAERAEGEIGGPHTPPAFQ